MTNPEGVHRLLLKQTDEVIDGLDELLHVAPP